MHASLFQIKTRIADNVKKHFIESDAKSDMLKEYKCFLPALLFFSLVQLSAIEKEPVGTDNADMESSQKKRKHTWIWCINEYNNVKGHARRKRVNFLETEVASPKT